PSEPRVHHLGWMVLNCDALATNDCSATGSSIQPQRVCGEVGIGVGVGVGVGLGVGVVTGVPPSGAPYMGGWPADGGIEGGSGGPAVRSGVPGGLEFGFELELELVFGADEHAPSARQISTREQSFRMTRALSNARTSGRPPDERAFPPSGARPRGRNVADRLQGRGPKLTA